MIYKLKKQAIVVKKIGFEIFHALNSICPNKHIDLIVKK